MENLINNDCKVEISKFINIHEGNTCVLIGSGPSLDNSKTFLEYAVEKKFLLLGTNHTLCDDSFKLDYHFLGDLSALKLKCRSKKNYMNTPVNKKKIWYGKFIDVILNSEREHDKRKKYVKRTRRYFKKKTNGKLKIDNTKIHNNWVFLNHIKINQGIFKHLRPNKHLEISTIFIALEFGLLMGFKKIYLVGCDCTKLNKYILDQENNYWDDSENKSKLFPGWISMCNYIKTYHPDVKMYSVNPVGLKNLIPEDPNISV